LTIEEARARYVDPEPAPNSLEVREVSEQDFGGFAFLLDRCLLLRGCDLRQCGKCLLNLRWHCVGEASWKESVLRFRGGGFSSLSLRTVPVLVEFRLQPFL
jgi:hypothetical protein